MKKCIPFLTFVMLMMSLTGCISTKKIRYFQDPDSIYNQAQRIMQQYEMRLKPADQIYIKATCSEPDLLQIFSQNMIVGATGRSQGVTTTMSFSGSGGAINVLNGFAIDNQGCIKLPRLGKITVSGLTTEECAKVIEQRIIEEGVASDPEVHVYLINARVTVLGAVSKPGIVSLGSERNTIADVLAQCGDIDNTGLRRRVKLFREVDGERKMYELDMTKVDVFQSPAYYVQQNDMIYVEPNKSKTIRSSPFYTFLSAGSSILALLSTTLSLIFLVKRNTD